MRLVSMLKITMEPHVSIP